MNYNKVILAGRITRDPELSFTPSQMAICKFGIAVNKSWTGQDGQKNEKTCFVDCTAFKKTAENINKYFRKGDPILIDGELEFDSWTAQDGTKRSKHGVTIMNFQFVKAPEKDRTQYQSQPQAPQGGLIPDDDMEIPF